MSDARAFKNAAYAHLASVGKALASPARLELLELLAQAPRGVEALAHAIEQSVANTSHHLQALKRAHLVTAQREGVRITYALSGPDVAALLGQLQAVATGHLAELEKLTTTFFADRDALEALDGPTLLDRLRRDDVVLLDVRPEHEFAAGHLPGALSVPLSTLESRLGDIPSDRTVVAYCRGPFCTLSAEAAQRLRALGYDARRTDATVHSLAAAGDDA